MAKKSSPPSEITLHNTKSDEYRKVAADSTSGGVQPRGNFKMDFVLNYENTPDKEDIEITSDGRLGRRIDANEDSNIMIRERQVSVILDQQQAYDHAVWVLSEVLSSQEGMQNISSNDILQVLADAFEPVE